MDTLNESMKNALKIVAQQHGIQKYHIDILPGSNVGENFLGDCFKVSLKQDEDSFDEKTLKLFCKIPQEAGRIPYGLNCMFTREAFMLGVVLPRYKKLEDELGIINGFQSYPKLFASSSINLKEYLVMNDLSEEGYEMLDIHKGINVEYMQLALEEMGKFHALGFALKHHNSEVCENFQKSVAETLYKPDMEKSLNDLFIDLIKIAVDNLQLERKYELAWKNFYKNFSTEVINLCNGELAEPFAIITHGDMWNNNMLFKSENGVPEGVCFVDWQFSRYSSPALDISNYIFSSTTKSFRNLHYKKLINSYYNSVSSFLAKLGFEPEKIFPYSAFQDQLVKFGKYCLMTGVFWVLVYKNKEKPQDLEQLFKGSLQSANNTTDERGPYRRLQDAVVDLVDLGYL